MNPRLSIIIALSDSRAGLAATLESLLAQTFRSWEAIIVEGSADSDDLARDDAVHDPRFAFVRRPGAGPAAARNAGLDYARGEFIAFLDPHDTLAPDAYASLLALADTTGHGAVLGSWNYTDDAGRTLHGPEDVSKRSLMGLDQLLDGASFPMHAQLIHRDLLAFDRFDERLSGAEELDLFGRMAIRGVTWLTTSAVVGTSTLTPRVHAGPGAVPRFCNELRVVGDLFRRARKAGLTDQVNLSDAREAGLRHTHALRHAHLTLLRDRSPDKTLAAEIFASIRSELPISANLAALAIRDFQVVDRLAAAEMEDKVADYAAALAPWWRRCVAAGWAAPSFEGKARAALARELASMLDFAPEILDRCGAGRASSASTSPRPMIILGLGRNGRRLARELHARGLPVVVRDDGLCAAEAAASLPGIPITFIGPESAYDPEPLYLLSVLNDDAYLDRLPAGLDVVRWADVFRQRSDAIHGRLIRAWPAEDQLRAIQSTSLLPVRRAA